ncbi:MAG: glycosyltransferase [Phycisphaerales bacterium]
MRLFHYLSRFRPQDGGVPRAVLDLCAALAAHGHDVTLATGGAEMVPQPWRTTASSQATPGTARGSTVGARPGADVSAEVRAEALPRLLELGPWRWLRRLDASERRVVDEALRRCDVAHLHVPWDPLGIAIASRARALGTPYIVTPHGMLDDWTMAIHPIRKRLFLAAGARRFLELAALVQCNSATEAEESKRWLPRGRTIVAPLLTDLSPFAAPRPESREGGTPRLPPGHRVGRAASAECAGSSGADEPSAPAAPSATPSRGQPCRGAPARVLFLGRLDPIKGIEDLIDAIGQVNRAGVETALVIAGTGDDRYRRELDRVVAQCAVRDHVEFAGYVTGDAKQRLLLEADCSVLPSRHENWGVSLIESLAAATPVITTDAVNIWRELAESGGATIVPVRGTPAGASDGPARALAGALRALLSDRAELRERGERGRAWVFRELAPERVVRRYEEIYAEFSGVR